MEPTRLLLCLLATLLVCGCDRGGGGDGRQKVLNVYIWSEYLPQSVVDRFSRQTGIRVNVDTYDSNEALLAKLQSGAADYDLVVPSDYMVRTLIAQKLVQEIDRSKVKGWENLDADLMNKEFDPGNRYSVPYFWGTTGFGYNKPKLEALARETGRPLDLTSWDVLFDDRLEQRVLMLDDMRECFAVALKRMGKSINETDPQTLAAAAEMLRAQKKLVRTYDSGDFANVLGAGDVLVAHGYNGQLAKLAAEQPDRFAFVLPKEGGTFWMDNVCIPASAGNPDGAHAFLSFILEPEVGAEIVNAVSYASANAAARKHVKPEVLNDPAVYPPKAALARCEFMRELGPETTDLLDRHWTEIKGSSE